MTGPKREANLQPSDQGEYSGMKTHARVVAVSYTHLTLPTSDLV